MKKAAAILLSALLLTVAACSNPPAADTPVPLTATPVSTPTATAAQAPTPEPTETPTVEKLTPSLDGVLITEETINPYVNYFMLDYWVHYIFEYYRGATWYALTEGYYYDVYMETPDWRRAFTLSYPQFNEGTPFQEALNEYYRDKYEAELKKGDYNSEGPLSVIYSKEALYAYAWRDYYSVIISERSHWGHAIYNPYCDNFDTSTGKCLSLDDVFKVSADVYMPRMNESVLKWSASDEFDGLLQPYYADGSDPLPKTEQFMLTPAGLVLLYDTGTVAAMASGAVFLLVKYADIADILAIDVGEPLQKEPWRFTYAATLRELLGSVGHGWFLLPDIDKDGTPELIAVGEYLNVLGSESFEFSYTFRDGEVVPLEYTGDVELLAYALAARSSMSLMPDNKPGIQAYQIGPSAGLFGTSVYYELITLQGNRLVADTYGARHVDYDALNALYPDFGYDNYDQTAFDAAVVEHTHFYINDLEVTEEDLYETFFEGDEISRYIINEENISNVLLQPPTP